MVYCLDVLEEPKEEQKVVKKYVQRMEPSSRLGYISIDVTDHKTVWKSVEEIGVWEGRMNIYILLYLGSWDLRILRPEKEVLDYPVDMFNEERCNSEPLPRSVQSAIGDSTGVLYE